MEELERVPLDKPFLFINLFSVSEEANIDDLWTVFEGFQIADIIPNQTIGSLYDLKLKSREEFEKIVSKPKYFVAGRPFFLRFSFLNRQPQQSKRKRSWKTQQTPAASGRRTQGAFFQLEKARIRGTQSGGVQSGIQENRTG